MNLLEATKQAVTDSLINSDVRCIVYLGELGKNGNRVYEVWDYWQFEETESTVFGHIECIEGRDFSGNTSDVDEMNTMYQVLSIASGGTHIDTLRAQQVIA